jgi:hypothetical protein
VEVPGCGYESGTRKRARLGASGTYGPAERAKAGTTDLADLALDREL